jgi:hypothetical protein
VIGLGETAIYRITPKVAVSASGAGFFVDNVGDGQFTGGNAAIAANTPGGFKFARPVHVEGYYRFKVNDNVSVTSGVFAVFNPESNSENKTTVGGVLRASFTF